MHYEWYLSFAVDPVVTELASRCRARLVSPVLDLVDDAQLHLSLASVGFADELGAGGAASIIDQARARCSTVEPFAVGVEAVAVMHEGVVLGIEPDPALLRLYALLDEVLAAALERPPRAGGDRQGFWPHIALAYANGDAPAAPIREQVADLRGEPTRHITVAAVDLGAVERVPPAYRRTRIASLALGGALPPLPIPAASD